MSWSRIFTIVAIGVVAIITLNMINIVNRQAAGDQKRAYLLVQADITHPERYAEYAKVSPGIIQHYGGRYLARAGRTETLEGPPARSRVVVIEFPSMDAAKAFYNSPEYTAARKLRDGASDAQFVLVEAM